MVALKLNNVGVYLRELVVLSESDVSATLITIYSHAAPQDLCVRTRVSAVYRNAN